MMAVVYLNIGTLETDLFRYIQTLVFTLNLMRALHLKNTLDTIMNLKKGICIDCPKGSPEKPLIAGRCQTHYWQYRAKKNAEKKPKEVKPRKAIPRRSKKKIIEDLQYSVLRKEFLEKPENKICKINGMPTTEIHHKYCGKDRAKYYLDTSTWLAVNRDSHNFIHDNPKKSRELGYLM